MPTNADAVQRDSARVFSLRPPGPANTTFTTSFAGSRKRPVSLYCCSQGCALGEKSRKSSWLPCCVQDKMSSQKAVQLSLGAVRSLSAGMARLQAASAQGGWAKS